MIHKRGLTTYLHVMEHLDLLMKKWHLFHIYAKLLFKGAYAAVY